MPELNIFRDFPRANFGPVIGPYFSQIETEIPNVIKNFQMSYFVLHFGENFMKIAPKIIMLQLITFRFVVGFDAYFSKQISKYFKCSEV